MCFGRDDLIEEIVTSVENMRPVALIGPGGIGKTSIALTVLHHDRIKQRFGQDHRFIRCDQFPATLPHLLNRLSKVIGAGVDNPENLTPLYPFLSSKEMILVLDNAESILDPKGADATEIYDLVEELGQLPTLCLCITSRISTIPPECETFEIPTLSPGAARHTFYHIYKSEKRSDLVDDILEQLDLHPLSITLLATVAHQNKWDTDRLGREWEQQRTRVLQTRHNKSLAATIELSLASPMFQEFGPNARGLLEVIAFFPQGVDESNLAWLFPTISDRADLFDGFCILSLTHRSNGFITMLAPLRDYLSPKDPKLSPLLCMAKECYFTRLLVDPDPDKTDFEETRWITSEDVNVEHLLDVFTTIDPNSDTVWHACIGFVNHLCWHKKRPTMLTPKVEALPDDHQWKPIVMIHLAVLTQLAGNFVKCAQLFGRVVELPEGPRNSWDPSVTQLFQFLSSTPEPKRQHKEEIKWAKELLETCEQFSDGMEHGDVLMMLASLLMSDDQLDAAEEAVACAISVIPEEGNQHQICQCHIHLGDIYRYKRETGMAIDQYELAIRIASPFDWHDELSEAHLSLAHLFLPEKRLDEAQAHAERAKLSAVNNQRNLGRATMLLADVLFRRLRLEEAKSEALRAVDILEKVGAEGDIMCCEELLRVIQEVTDMLVDPSRVGFNCEFLR